MSSANYNSSVRIGHSRGDRHGAVSASAPVQNSNSESSPEALTHGTRRRNWTAEKSIRFEDLENELEAYEPLIKCETKCEKTYYKCPMRNRFEDPMIVRTVREVVSGSILIETCAMSHCHDDSKEKFQRGLSFRVQESIREIKRLLSRSGLELFIGLCSWIPTILVAKMFLSVSLLHICTGFEHARAHHTWSTVFRAFVL
jgi:hypothetical protein